MIAVVVDKRRRGWRGESEKGKGRDVAKARRRSIKGVEKEREGERSEEGLRSDSKLPQKNFSKKPNKPLTGA